MSNIEQTQKLGIVDFVKMIYEGHPEYSLLAVKAPIEDVVQALIDLRNTLVKRDKRDWSTMKFKEYRIQSRQLGWEKQIALQPYCTEEEEAAGEGEILEPGVPILQVRDTDWTVVIRSLSWLGSDEIEDVPNEAKALSAKFQTQAITLMEEDTSGAIGYELFGNGELLERLQHCDGEVTSFESELRSEQPEIPDWDYEDEEDCDREYDIATEPRVVFINKLFSDLGIYLPAVWYSTDNGKPALQVMPSSEGTVIRADWLSLKEEWTTDVEQPTKTMQPNFNDIIGRIFDAIAAPNDSPTVSEAQAQVEFDRLSIAAQAGDTELFRALVTAENQRQRRKSDPPLLISAVMAGRTDVVRALIAAGADVNAKVEMFFTFDALETAVDKGYIEIVKLLLEANADPNWNNRNPGLCPIRKACQKGQTEIVRLLIDAGAAVKFETGFRLLVDAAESSNAEIVQLLIEAGCNVNTRKDDTPLTAACRRARVGIVQTLIAANANVNKVGMHDMAPLVTVFLALKMNAALAGHGLAERESDVPQKITQIVEALAAAGADLNVYDVMGKTALMLAIEQQNLDAAQVLIHAGANVNAIMQPNRDSIFVREAIIICDSALHIAAKADDSEAIALLLKAGADPALLNSEGIPALRS